MCVLSAARQLSPPSPVIRGGHLSTPSVIAHTPKPTTPRRIQDNGPDSDPSTNNDIPDNVLARASAFADAGVSPQELANRLP